MIKVLEARQKKTGGFSRRKRLTDCETNFPNSQRAVKRREKLDIFVAPGGRFRSVGGY